MRGPIIAAVLLTSTVVHADLVSEEITLSEQGYRFPDVATAGDHFLVVWADCAQKRICGRFVGTSDAKPIAPVVCVSEPVTRSALFPAVGYAREFDALLVTWDDEGRGDVIHGQRIKRNGTLIGSNFTIATVAGTIRAAVAWCGGAKRWLVVYGAPLTGSDVHGRLLEACTPTTCAAASAECGVIGDGCGGTLDGGMCVAAQTCGGSGTPYKCGEVK